MAGSQERLEGARSRKSRRSCCPVTAKHICILFRRFTNFGRDITRDYVRALEAREIPHLLVGSKSFHNREEVETLRAALTAIEWPEDELSVFATLKGSLFAIPDNLLLRFHHEIGRLHPFRKLPDNLAPEFQPVADALQPAGRSASRSAIAGRSPTPSIRCSKPRARTPASRCARPGTRCSPTFIASRDLARSFELSGGISFRGFVEELEAQAEKAESPKRRCSKKAPKASA